MKRKNEEEINMEIFRDLLNRLINDNKITFSFYNNSLLDLDLLQICYNKTNDTIELEFRDVMGEYLKELRKIIKKKQYNIIAKFFISKPIIRMQNLSRTAVSINF